MTFDLIGRLSLMVLNIQIVDILDEAQCIFANLHCMQRAILCVFVKFVKYPGLHFQDLESYVIVAPKSICQLLEKWQSVIPLHMNLKNITQLLFLRNFF